VNVDTGEFAAITAEVSMLRAHAARRQPGRHRAQRQPGVRRRRPLDDYWQGGRVVAMQDVIRVADEVLTATDSCGEALRAVVHVAGAAVEMFHADGVPPEWLSQGEPR
jgi:hypothetical protein